MYLICFPGTSRKHVFQLMVLGKFLGETVEFLPSPVCHFEFLGFILKMHYATVSSSVKAEISDLSLLQLASGFSVILHESFRSHLGAICSVSHKLLQWKTLSVFG